MTMVSMWWTSGLKKSAVVAPLPGMGRYIWQEMISPVSALQPGVIEVLDGEQEERGAEAVAVLDEIGDAVGKHACGPTRS